MTCRTATPTGGVGPPYGTAGAPRRRINAGDALIFQAFARFAAAPELRRVLDVIALLMVRVVEGQALVDQLLARAPEAAVVHGIQAQLASWRGDPEAAAGRPDPYLRP